MVDITDSMGVEDWEPLRMVTYGPSLLPPTRLLYGLDVQLLKVKDTENLERVQRQCLKQFQGLPDNTSNSVCLALLGIPPIETILHKNLLNMFVNMVRNENSIEYKNAQR